MKKTILFALALCFTASLSATVIVTKSHGRWFGFRYVQEVYDNENYMLTCSGFGWSGCRFKVLNPELQASPGYGDLTPSALDAIDAAVMKNITETNTSGNLMYNSEYFVTYSYDLDSDTVKYTIYTQAEAKAAGLL